MQRWHSLIEWEPEPVRTESSDATTERMLSTASLRASTSSRMDLSGRSSLSSISTSSSFSECVLSSFYVHITIFVTLYLDYISSFFANISEIKPYCNLLSAVTIEKHPINCSKPHNIINSQQSFILMAFWVHSCIRESPIQGVVCKTSIRWQLRSKQDRFLTCVLDSFCSICRYFSLMSLYCSSTSVRRLLRLGRTL